MSMVLLPAVGTPIDGVVHLQSVNVEMSAVHDRVRPAVRLEIFEKSAPNAGNLSVIRSARQNSPTKNS